MPSALRQLVLARLAESFRQPETIFWTFVFPALLSIALGVAFREGAPPPVDVAVVAGPRAEPLARSIASDGALRARVVDGAAAERMLRGGRVALIVQPADPVVYRYDPARPEGRLAREKADAAIQKGAGRIDPLPAADAPVTERGARYIDFLVPGLLAMNLMGGGLWGIGWNVVDARVKKLLKLALATPMRRRDYLLSHILVRALFVPLEVVPLLAVARLLFDVRVSGGPADLAAVVCAGMFCFAGLGTLVACRARTSQTVYGLINLITLPMFVLSGVFFSTSRFPEAVQPFLRLLPLTSLADGLRAVMGEGASVAMLGREFLVLGAWGFLSFVLAVRWFRWE